MTKKEFKRLKEWSKNYKGTISGYIYTYPTASQFIYKPLEYYEAGSGKDIWLYANNEGFKVKDTSIAFKCHNYTNDTTQRLNIPFNYIKRVVITDFNN